jgi:hypothetical protein
MSLFAPRCPECHNRMNRASNGYFYCFVNGCKCYEERISKANQLENHRNKEDCKQELNKMSEIFKGMGDILNDYSDKILLNVNRIDEREPELILFSDRLRLEKEYRNWVLENKLVINPQTMIIFLQTKYDFYQRQIIIKGELK